MRRMSEDYVGFLEAAVLALIAERTANGRGEDRPIAGARGDGELATFTPAWIVEQIAASRSGA
jgi:hypothetical protein